MLNTMKSRLLPVRHVAFACALLLLPISAAQSSSEEGVIREARCGASTGAKVEFAILGDTLVLYAPDLTRIEYRANGKESTAAANPCSEWKGRNARITYKPATEKTSGGEITAMDFQ